MTEKAAHVTNLDPWLDAYAARAETLSVSEVRALFSVVSRPEVVSLAGGMPNVSALPNDVLQKAYEGMMAKRGPLAMQYGGGGHKHAAGFKVPRDHELAKA